MIQTFLVKPYTIQLKNTSKPEPKKGEVLIRLSKIGICGSDIHMFKQGHQAEEPLTIGHEGMGVIEKVGEGISNQRVGERVVIEPNIQCFNCPECWSGRGNICRNKRIIGVNETGCFAEHITLPSEFVWKIPDGISDEDGVTIEPTAVGHHALFSSKAKPGDAIAIIGCGAIGLLLTHLALRLGYRVFVSEINQDKLKIAKDMGGIEVTADGNLEQQAEALGTVWQEQEVQAVFECARSDITASLVTAAAPRGAEIVLVGLSRENNTFRPFKIVRESISMVPSMIYDYPFTFKRVIQLIATKTIEPHFIISGQEPLQNLQSALEEAAKGIHTKMLITV